MTSCDSTRRDLKAFYTVKVNPYKTLSNAWHWILPTIDEEHHISQINVTANLSKGESI
jgi:hypothetical protein